MFRVFGLLTEKQADGLLRVGFTIDKFDKGDEDDEFKRETIAPLKGDHNIGNREAR